MRMFQEKSVRHFTMGILLVLFLSILLELGFLSDRTEATQQLLLEHDQALASSLLAQAVSPDVIAKALTQSEISDEGIHLLNQLGICKSTNPWLLPALFQYQKTSLLHSALKLLLPSLLLLSISLWFLNRRERLYLEAIQTVSAYTGGSFDHPLPQYCEGSLYRLFGCINHMATALKAGQDREHDTKEFLKNTISDISHQLKTPLAALSMYNEIILEEPDQVQTVQTFTEKSNAAIERMRTLILSLLKIARLDVGSITFQKSPTPISDLLQLSLAQLSDRTVRENKTLILPKDQSVSVFCDPEWTGEALGNLLKNAFDHTLENGTIQVQVQETPLDTRILVSDNGKGILPEDLHHIFKRFYQGKTPARSQGVGLGLPLAQAMIQGQGGILSVESTPGSGTTFTIILPAFGQLTKL